MDSEMKAKNPIPFTSTRRRSSSSNSYSNIKSNNNNNIIVKSKSPIHTGNKENDDNKKNAGNNKRCSPRCTGYVRTSASASASNAGVSLCTPATQWRVATPTPPLGNGNGRKPLKDLLTTSNPRQKVVKRRGRVSSSLLEQEHPHPYQHHLRKRSSTPTPYAKLNHTPTATGTPGEHLQSSNPSPSQKFKMNMSAHLHESKCNDKSSSIYAQCGLKEKCLSLSNSLSRSGKISFQNGMKNNCNFNTGNLRKNYSGSVGLGKCVAGRRRHDANREEDDSFRGRSEEIRVNLTTFGSSKATSAAATLHRVEATPLQKVYLNNCYQTPAHILLEKGDDYTTPAPRFRGRYEDSHVFKGREDAIFAPPTIGRDWDFTPAHTALGKGEDFTPATTKNGNGGDFTPAPTKNGNGGDFTPAPITNGNIGDFTSAQHNMHATPEQRTQVTPPVQPSISPEIHSQTLDELKDGHRCFGAGHVMAPVLGKVRDRRKCRPRGILTVGEATPLLLDENRRFPLVPVPVAASVKWMSPRDAKKLTNLPVTQVTPSPGFTQGSPSISSKKSTSQGTPPSGLTAGDPSSEFNSKNLSPQATSLSGIVDSSSSSGSQASPMYGCTQAILWSGFRSKLSSCQSPTPSGFTLNTQNLSTILPTRFAQEVPYIRGMSSSGLTTGTGNLIGTPSSGISSKVQNLIATPSNTSSKLQNRFSTTSGLTLEILNGQGISTPEYNQEISNTQATSPPGFSSQFFSCYQSNLDISPQDRFHPYNSSQCGDPQGESLSVSSQFGFNPESFPQDSDSHRTCLSLANLVISSQYAGSSEVCRSSKLKASSMDKDNLRQEMQMPVPSSKDSTQVRISWREGLMSRIFKLSELDCCDLNLEGDGKRKEDGNVSISRENHLLSPEDNMKLEYSCPFSNDLQLDAPFGSFEYMSEVNADKLDPSLLLASSLHQENVLSESLVRPFISPASQGVETKSIYAENATTSIDLDWTFCYKNQLFEEATRAMV